MEKGPGGGVLREIRALYTNGTLVGLTDAELLERFLARDGDAAEDAFAALLHRHGPTCWAPAAGCCRDRTMRRTSSRRRSWSWRAGRVDRPTGATGELALRRRGPDRPGRPASRRAASARGKAADGTLRGRDGTRPRTGRRAADPGRGAEPAAAALPGALVACELEGKSRREAAEQLGIPEGTLSTHLARGRKQLRERLLRRGVSLGPRADRGTVPAGPGRVGHRTAGGSHGPRRERLGSRGRCDGLPPWRKGQSR